MDCDSEAPAASGTACLKVKDKYIQITVTDNEREFEQVESLQVENWRR